jgi:hypothetical protein
MLVEECFETQFSDENATEKTGSEVFRQLAKLPESANANCASETLCH